MMTNNQEKGETTNAINFQEKPVTLPENSARLLDIGLSNQMLSNGMDQNQLTAQLKDGQSLAKSGQKVNGDPDFNHNGMLLNNTDVYSNANNFARSVPGMVGSGGYAGVNNHNVQSTSENGMILQPTIQQHGYAAGHAAIPVMNGNNFSAQRSNPALVNGMEGNLDNNLYSGNKSATINTGNLAANGNNPNNWKPPVSGTVVNSMGRSGSTAGNGNGGGNQLTQSQLQNATLTNQNSSLQQGPGSNPSITLNTLSGYHPQMLAQGKLIPQNSQDQFSKQQAGQPHMTNPQQLHPPFQQIGIDITASNFASQPSNMYPMMQSGQQLNMSHQQILTVQPMDQSANPPQVNRSLSNLSNHGNMNSNLPNQQTHPQMMMALQQYQQQLTNGAYPTLQQQSGTNQVNSIIHSLPNQQQGAMQNSMAQIQQVSFSGAKFATRAWHNTTEHGDVRKGMVEKIIELLKTRRPNATEDWHEKLPHMAKRLEDALYHEAVTLADYSDHNSLKQRLQKLALSMGGNKQQQQQQQLQQQNTGGQHLQNGTSTMIPQNTGQQQIRPLPTQQNPKVSQQQYPSGYNQSTIPSHQTMMAQGLPQQDPPNQPQNASGNYPATYDYQNSAMNPSGSIMVMQNMPQGAGTGQVNAGDFYRHGGYPPGTNPMMVNMQKNVEHPAPQQPGHGPDVINQQYGMINNPGPNGFNQQRLYFQTGVPPQGMIVGGQQMIQQPNILPQQHPDMLLNNSMQNNFNNAMRVNQSVGQQQNGPNQPLQPQQQYQQQPNMHNQNPANGLPQGNGFPPNRTGMPPQNLAIGQTQHSEEHRKQVLKQQQQRLLLLRHASKCPHSNGQCPVTPHCWSMKQLWKHIMSCKDQECKIAHCVSSRYVLSHYSKCKDISCPVCQPVRDAIKKNYDKSKVLVNSATNGTIPGQPYGSHPNHPYPSGNLAPLGSQQMPPQGGLQGKSDLPASKRSKKADRDREKERESTSAMVINQGVGLMQQRGMADHQMYQANMNKVTAGYAQSGQVQVMMPIEKKIFPLDPISSAIYSFTSEQISAHYKSIHEGMTMTATRIKEICKPVLDDLLKTNLAYGVFGSPVDPVALNLPDYHEIIKFPMDLGTISKRLDQGSYRDIHNFVNDVHLTFDNAMVYNPKNSDVHSLARMLKKDFDIKLKQIQNDLERSFEMKRNNKDNCSICGEILLKFEPPVFYCNGKCGGTRIRRNAVFYSNNNNSYHWCSPCFNELKESQPIRLPDCTLTKAELAKNKRKHTEESEESWVQCGGCERWTHQICSLFNSRRNTSDSVAFVCPMCLESERKKRPDGGVVAITNKKMRAADLPVNNLSQFLEKRIVKRLEIAYRDTAFKLGVNVDEVEKCPQLILRQVSCLDKMQQTREGVYNRYKDKNYPSEFPCRTKCLVLFQNIDGQDVILFGMYVYEYGHKCPQPNQRRVYISYLDSVHYFRPKQYRTMVYHEILISYLEYVRARGFHTAHIWACPPQKGDDYIFYVHPTDQKTPKASILRVWYDDMLKLGQERKIVEDVVDIHTEYLCDPTNDATILPYFEGDYWVNEAEVIIKELKEDTITSVVPINEDQVEVNTGNVAMTESNKSKRKNKVNKRTSTGQGKSTSNSKVNRDPVMAKLASIIQPMKDTFFVARLLPKAVADYYAELREKELRQESAVNSTETNDQRERKLEEEALSGTDVTSNMSSISSKIKVKEENESSTIGQVNYSESRKEANESSIKVENIGTNAGNDDSNIKNEGIMQFNEDFDKVNKEMRMENMEEVTNSNQNDVEDDAFGAAASSISDNISSGLQGSKTFTEEMDLATEGDMDTSVNQAEDVQNQIEKQTTVVKDETVMEVTSNESSMGDSLKEEQKIGNAIAMTPKSRTRIRGGKMSDMLNMSDNKIRAETSSVEGHLEESAVTDTNAMSGRKRPFRETEEKDQNSNSSSEMQLQQEWVSDINESKIDDSAKKPSTAVSEIESDSKNRLVASIIPNKTTTGLSTEDIKMESSMNSNTSSNPNQNVITKTTTLNQEKGSSTDEDPFSIRNFLSPDDLPKFGNDTEDIDEVQECEHFDTRQSFLNLCQGNHYQFDQLRRAKHTSMMVLYLLHTPDAPKFVPSCKICNADILVGNRYHCEICEIDFCHNCFSVNGGPKMHSHGLRIIPIANSTPVQLTEEQRRERQRSIQLHMQLLQHSATCNGVECKSKNCMKMKEFLKHDSTCKITTIGGCRLCLRIHNLLNIHARACRIDNCTVPRCKELKEHFRNLALRQQQMDDRRRMKMNIEYSRTGAGNSGTQNVADD